LPEKKIEALILRRIIYSDTSLVIHYYSADNGRGAVIAKGVRKKNSRLDPVLQTGYIVELLFNEKANRDLHILRDADLINAYSGNRCSYERMLSSTAICEILDRSQLGAQEDQRLYVTARETLELIAGDCPYPVNHVYWFLLYTLAHSGYYLDINRCVNCGAETNSFLHDDGSTLDKRNGALSCPNCTYGHEVFNISTRILRVLLFLSNQDREGIGSREISSPTRKSLGELLNQLYHIHLDHWNGIYSLDELAVV
jgi:DNA repair protein RecO (recombination protein O)